MHSSTNQTLRLQILSKWYSTQLIFYQYNNHQWASTRDLGFIIVLFQIEQLLFQNKELLFQNKELQLKLKDSMLQRLDHLEEEVMHYVHSFLHFGGH